MDSVIGFLQGLMDKLGMLSPAIIVLLAGVVEFGLRFIKSEKALGIIHGISGLLLKVAQAVGLLASLVGKVAELSDKLLGQRLK
jgi:hypothetical protein